MREVLKKRIIIPLKNKILYTEIPVKSLNYKDEKLIKTELATA